MSDRLRSTPDTPWRPAGTGNAPTFRCGVCDLPSFTGGRRQVVIRGLKVYICRACVQQRAAKQAAAA